MVKVGLKGRHTLTGVSRSGVLTGAASRKAATKKLMGGQAAVGRIRQAAARRVPFTGVSKTSAGIRRAARAPVSTAARAAAGMWAHDKFEEQAEAEEDEEWSADSSARSTWSGDHGVQVIDHGAVSAAARAPKVVIHRGRGTSAPASFKITLAGGRQHLAKSGGARGSTPVVTLAPAPSTTAASRRDVEGEWRHDLFDTRSQGRGGGRSRAGASGGRSGRAARKRSVRTGAAAEVSSRPLADRLDMALGS